MLRTCAERSEVAKRVVNHFRTKLSELSEKYSGKELTDNIETLCQEIDRLVENSRSMIQCISIELDTHYRRLLGDTYTRADLMAFLNMQKNDIIDRFDAVVRYPGLFDQAHEMIHRFLCQDVS